MENLKGIENKILKEKQDIEEIPSGIYDFQIKSFISSEKSKEGLKVLYEVQLLNYLPDKELILNCWVNVYNISSFNQIFPKEFYGTYKSQPELLIDQKFKALIIFKQRKADETTFIYFDKFFKYKKLKNKKEIYKIWFNWFHGYNSEMGQDEYTEFEVGQFHMNGKKQIKLLNIELIWLDSTKGYYHVTFDDGSKQDIFNINRVFWM